MQIHGGCTTAVYGAALAATATQHVLASGLCSACVLCKIHMVSLGTCH